MIDVSKVLFLEDGRVHAALASLRESFTGDEVVERVVFVGANDVAGARFVFDALMSNGAFWRGLTESEVSVDGREADEELAGRFSGKERFSLFLVDISVEPMLAESTADFVEISVSMLIWRCNGAEPVQ